VKDELDTPCCPPDRMPHLEQYTMVLWHMVIQHQKPWIFHLHT
jgi:hypothetical protein